MSELLIQLDLFQRPNTAYGAAGTTTGAGNGWVDVTGNHWQILSNALVAVNSNTAPRGFLVRPLTEDVLEQRHVVDYVQTAGGGYPYTMVRADRTSFDAYAAYVNTSNQLKIVRMNGSASTETALATISSLPARVVGTVYRVDLKAVAGAGGSTDLVAKFTTAADPATVIATATANVVSGSALPAGSCGMSHLFSAQVTRSATYNENAPTSTAYTLAGPSGGIVNADSTAFTVSLTPAGSIPPTDPTTVTPSDGGGGGNFTPTTVTLSSAAQQATFVYQPHSSGSKTISVTDNGGLADPASLSYLAQDAVLTPGVISTTAQDLTSISLSATPSTGGTGTLTYQWYRSTTPGFTPGTGNLLTGATSRTLVDTGLTADTLYFYKLVTTDSLAVTANPGQYPVSTRKITAPLVLVFFEDSLGAYAATNTAATVTPTATGAQTVPDRIAKDLSLRVGSRPVVLVNRAIAGTTSSDWAVGGAIYTAAKAAAVAAKNANPGGRYVVNIRLGANDGRTITRTSVATYLANITGIVNDLVAAGFEVMLHQGTYTVPGSFGGQFDETSTALAKQYDAALTPLINGTTVHLGSTGSYRYFALNPGELADGVHPLAPGQGQLAAIDARALLRVIGGPGLYRKVNGFAQPILLNRG